jgi:hypothetical protein
MRASTLSVIVAIFLLFELGAAEGVAEPAKKSYDNPEPHKSNLQFFTNTALADSNCANIYSQNARVKSVYRVLFGGDTSFGENYQAWLERHGQENILKSRGYAYSLAKLHPLLKKADIAIVNLETPLVSGGQSEPAVTKKYMHWADGPKTTHALKIHNIRIVSLANNHTLDFGIDGLQQTLRGLDQSGLKWLGAGLNEKDAGEPFHCSVEFGAKRFALYVVAGFEYRRNYDKQHKFYAAGDRGGVNAWKKITAAGQIRVLRKRVHNAFIVAFPHWGDNYVGRSTAQQKLARAMINAGADLVIGHGAHILQEIEPYKGKWIIYGLGNFVFNSPGRYQHRNVKAYSLAAMLNIREIAGRFRTSLHLYPIFSDNLITNYQPRMVAGHNLKEIRKLLVPDSAGARRATRMPGSSKDEIGGHFTLDLGAVLPMD